MKYILTDKVPTAFDHGPDGPVSQLRVASAPEWEPVTIRELLAVEAFSSLLEAQVLVQDWRIEYNTLRPHSALGNLTPTDYAKAWTTNHPALS